MTRKKNVDFVRKSEKTNCYSSDVNWPKLDESVSVANTYLGIGSPELVTVGVSDKYFEMNFYPGLNPFANSTDFILGTSIINKSVLSANKHWLNINEAVSVANTYLGVDSPQLATVTATNKYFNGNVYTGVNPLKTSNELIFGQNNFRTSLLSDKNHWSSLDGSLSVANANLGIDSHHLANIGISDRYINKNVYTGVNSLARSMDLILEQSTIRRSVLSETKHWLNLNESVSVANNFLGVGSPQLASLGASDKYSNRNVYSGENNLVNTTKFILGQSTISPSLLSANKHRLNLDESVSVANTFLGTGSLELANFNSVDKYSNRSVYSGVNHLGSTTDFIFGKSTISPTLLSDKNQWSSIAGANYFGSDNKFVGSLNIGHLNKQLGKNGYLTNPISAFKEYDVFNIGNDFLKRENKDLERCIKQECQKIAEMVKIDPNHIGLEACGTSQKPTFNIYFVFTGSITSNNLQIGDKNITIVNYGK